MESAPNLRTAFKAFFRVLSPRRRRQGALALVLMIFGAAAEMLGISAILVFLTVLTTPEKLTRTSAWHDLVQVLQFDPNPLVVATIGFITVMLTSGAVRLSLTWLTSSFAINAGHDFSEAAYRKITSQPYRFYLVTGSDEILSRFERIHFTNNLIVSGVQALVATFVSVLIIGFLLFLDFWVAITIGAVLVGSYVGISLASRSKLIRNSKVIAAAHAERVNQVQQALGGIRDILIDHSQWVFQRDFRRSANRARRPQVINGFVQNSPRVAIEIIGMLSIMLIALAISQSRGGLVGALPILGGLAVGAQRLLPLLQQSYYGWSVFFGNRQSLIDVGGLLLLPDPTTAPRASGQHPFNSSICFDDVSFAYSGDRRVLRDVNFKILKGERIGIVGPTGSGKSTLTDLLLGLLEPTVGRILIDDAILRGEILADWQAQIAHVPQSIYLSDNTIARNIAFGVPADKVDISLVKSAAVSAGLHQFIIGLPEQYDTRCGERGVRLSGGQRQRVGIARALYKRASILVLDEATSALDNETERAVMDSIAGLSSDITIIMIAHRLTSLSDCDRIFRVERGVLTEATKASLFVHEGGARRA